MEITRFELSNIKMTAGNEAEISHVILDGILKQWVAVGWIDIRKATKADSKKYPVVVD